MLSRVEAQVVRADKPKSKAWFLYSSALWLRARHFASLCFRLLIFNIRNAYYARRCDETFRTQAHLSLLTTPLGRGNWDPIYRARTQRPTQVHLAIKKASSNLSLFTFMRAGESSGQGEVRRLGATLALNFPAVGLGQVA